MTRTRLRLRRWTAVASGTALALVALAIAAPGAQAAPTPRTFTSTISPAAAKAGVATTYSIVVKNTSTVISAMDHVTFAVPAGFTVTPGSVTAPRGGWTASLNAAGTELSARATKLLAPVLKGESLTLSFTATDTTPCHVGTAVWTPKADGVIIDPYVPQGLPPSVSITPVADRFVITSVEDVSSATSGNQVVVGTGFAVSGEFWCGGAAAPTASASTLALTKAPGAPAGTLTSTPASVPAGSTTAGLTNASYDTVVNGVGLVADWNGGADDTTSVDVLGAAATSGGQPGTTLSVPGATTTLTKGANGPVSLLVAACNPGDSMAPCSDGTEIQLNGDFKGLYTAEAPASITWTCPWPECRNVDHVGVPPFVYTWNYECQSDTCQLNKNDLFGGREVEEDFRSYPVYVSLKKTDGSYTDFKAAGRCVPLPTKTTKSSDRYTLLHKTGKIVDSAAIKAGFCVDVNAITRAGGKFEGELRMPILFVEDPRIRP